MQIWVSFLERVEVVCMIVVGSGFQLPSIHERSFMSQESITTLKFKFDTLIDFKLDNMPLPAQITDAESNEANAFRELSDDELATRLLSISSSHVQKWLAFNELSKRIKPQFEALQSQINRAHQALLALNAALVKTGWCASGGSLSALTKPPAGGSDGGNNESGLEHLTHTLTPKPAEPENRAPGHGR